MPLRSPNSIDATELELVEYSPATGYRVSHAIGKQPANTYKAVRSLEDEGAIIVDSLEHVMGLLSMNMEKVHEAVWSDSNFLSCMQHNNLTAELIAIGPRSIYSGPADDVSKITEGITLAQFRPPGLERLIRSYGDGEAH